MTLSNALIQNLPNFSPSLNSKISNSLNIIKLAYSDYGPKIGLCFNGGKDSTIVLDLVNRYKNSSKISAPILPFFLDDKDQFQEVRDFIKEAQNIWGIEVEKLNGKDLKTGFERLIEDFKMNSFFLGQRESDPNSKNLSVFSPTTHPWPEAMRILPIFNWSYEDVWNYIDILKIPTCKLYSKGYTSIGSKCNTIPNPLLKDNNNYLHARNLKDFNKERFGRNFQ